jgi:hypothetical protein
MEDTTEINKPYITLSEIAKTTDTHKIKSLLEVIIKIDRINMLEALGEDHSYGFTDWLDYPIKLPTEV